MSDISFEEFQYLENENLTNYSSIKKQNISYQTIEQKEIDNFTDKLTNLLKKMDYFNWILYNSHGIDASTGLSDYMVWPTDSEARGEDIQAIKQNNVVTFKHKKGHGGHNIMILTSQILSQVISGYLLTNNKTMETLTEQFCKGITATMKGMMFDENDLEQYIMARNIIPESHSYIIKNERKIKIDYNELRNIKQNWNANRIHFPNNPFFGDIYVTNTRSQDDLPHIFRAIAFLPDIINQSKNSNLINTAKETQKYIQYFCKNIINNNYKILTKNENGKIYTPKRNLASLSVFEKNARLTTALLGYEHENNIKIKKGQGGLYELIASKINYYNHKIFNGFHMTATLYSQIKNNEKTSKKLLKGLKKRAKKLVKKQKLKTPDLAIFLLQAATVGLELTSKQTNIIHNEFSKAIKAYENFSRWNLWDESVPNGTYGPNGGFKPDSEGLIRPEELGLFFEYCYSPYRKGKNIVNIETIKSLFK